MVLRSTKGGFERFASIFPLMLAKTSSKSVNRDGVDIGHLLRFLNNLGGCLLDGGRVGSCVRGLGFLGRSDMLLMHLALEGGKKLQTHKEK